MPCIYFTNVVFGRFGSGFLRYRYSAICFNTPIKKLHHKDTACIKKMILKIMERGYDAVCPAFSQRLLLN